MPSASSRSVEPCSTCSALLVEFGARGVERVLLLLQRRASARRAAPAAGRARRAARRPAPAASACSRAAVSCACAASSCALPASSCACPASSCARPSSICVCAVGELLGAVLPAAAGRRTDRAPMRRRRGPRRSAATSEIACFCSSVNAEPSVGLIDDGCRHPGAVGKLLGELVDDGAGRRAGDVEAVAERPAEGEECADRDAEDEHPGDDHLPCAACGERTQAVKQCGHGVSSKSV